MKSFSKKLILALLFVLLLTPKALAQSVIGQHEIPLSQAMTQESAINACLAGMYMNQTIIYPGEVFSFNRTVGERLPERYFILAPISSRTKYVVYDHGGGICMTSSILHQAVKDAGLRTVERHNHVTPVSYLPTGEDAAITWGVQDYRFKNTLANPIKINVTILNNILKIELIEIPQKPPM